MTGEQKEKTHNSKRKAIEKREECRRRRMETVDVRNNKENNVSQWVLGLLI